MEHPARLIGIGFGLLIAGAVLPFLMVLGLVESTWYLNLVALLCEVSGITVGFLGLTMYGSLPRK